MRLLILCKPHHRGIESGMIKKLTKLYGGNIKLPCPICGYTNLTDLVLTQDQEDIMNVGLNCHFLTKPHPHCKRIEIKMLLDDIQQLESKKKVTTSSDLQSTLLAEAAKSRGSFQSSKVKKNHILAAKQLRENKEIVM
ncbi:hypothetical protein E2C01_078861 [Portunus trituberculatus]|uniref:Uncharacterized protein n=1 Tax=Portunus trituberculatus TaxID=210409 RepID=A0A5B7IV96_PORTR|nr:hypothetical protein [Portunus trituberculatus]